MMRRVRALVGWVGVGIVLGGSIGADSVLAGESRAKLSTRSTLATEADHIRQRAFDGKPETYFESSGPAKADDSFRIDLDTPTKLNVLAVESGHGEGQALLTKGVLETSADGEAFTKVADFDAQGRAEAPADALKGLIRALRVRATADLGHPLAIREFRIEAEGGRIRPFAHPVEFRVDSKDAPELQEWTEETARLCEAWYDALNDELPSEGFNPTDRIALTMKKDYNGVAEAGGGRITGSVRYFQRRRKDRGAFIHETVHIIQNYRSRRNPGWLVEGVADYVRFFIFEPGQAGPVDPKTARYDASYRTTATFLDYVSRTYDKELVKKLNAAMRAGKYRPELFQELTGKPLATLGDDWRATLQPKPEAPAAPK